MALLHLCEYTVNPGSGICFKLQEAAVHECEWLISNSDTGVINSMQNLSQI